MKLKKKVLIIAGVVCAAGVGFALGNDKCRGAIVNGAKKGASTVGGWFKKTAKEEPQQTEPQKPQQERPRYNNYGKPRYNNNGANQQQN